MFKNILDQLSNQNEVTVSSLKGASSGAMIAYLSANLTKKTAKPKLILCVFDKLKDAEDAEINIKYFCDSPIKDLRLQENSIHKAADSELKPEILLFPPLPGKPNQDTPTPTDVLANRLKTVHSIIENNESPKIILATTDSVNEPLQPKKILAQAFFNLAVNDVVDPMIFVEQLISTGYKLTHEINKQGEIQKVSGGLINFFPFASEHPIRLEFFDEEIESIRFFDAQTQISFKSVKSLSILLSNDPGSIPSDKGGKLSHCEGLLDFIPQDSLLVLPTKKALADAYDSIRKSWWRRAFLPSLKKATDKIESFKTLRLISLGRMNSIDFTHKYLEELFSDEIVPTFEKIADFANNGIDTRIIASTESDLERISGLINEHLGKIPENINLEIGDVTRGFYLESALFPSSTKISGIDLNKPENQTISALLCVPTYELFHKKRSKVKFADMTAHTKAVENYLDLKENDLVVHVTYGIAKFRGLKQLTLNKQVGDYLCLEFDKGRTYYAPVTEVSLIQKYIGSRLSEPPLSVFRGASWNARKKKVEQAVNQLAQQFLEISAVRAVSKGISHKIDQAFYHQFVSDFPFQETPDQDSVSTEIELDLKKTIPMDRLLCGDVGFGKTELAMRAAFIAVLNNYQVLILVPTKILAQQHLDSFTERFNQYPVSVDVLTQYQTKQEQQKTLENLLIGKLDILIGTHRLLSDDVKPKNLGLLIIDEEQRFGVDHKEKLKSMRFIVDVLTLSATPIPRTLHLALLGVRDISTLSTAPQNRKPVITKISYFEEEQIRQAVSREISRQGQVFFLHNNIAQLGKYKKLLLSLMPDLRIGTVHSKLNRLEISSIMGSFRAGLIDVLLCTTIIEAGLDYPNANTLIVNRADRFGLSQLHQLRGRVGREERQAYAYFLISADTALTEIAQMRLDAVSEFSHLGAGFDIAMRDLEIRGAGNVLGKEQSGHIAAIGYELYIQLLQRTIAKLSNKKPDARIVKQQVSINLGQDFIIPSDYISHTQKRLEFYHRISRVYDEEELAGITAEMRDRFGKLPKKAELYINAEKLRIRCANLDVRKVFYRQKSNLVIEAEQLSKIEDCLLPLSDRLEVMGQHEIQVNYRASNLHPAKILQILLDIF